MIIPTTYPALHDPEVYVDPESFNPDRWLDGGEAEAAHKNWLVFGTGPHVCLGQHYAIMNFMAMIGKASLFLDWEHHPTEKSEEIKVFATIFPQVCWRVLCFFICGGERGRGGNGGQREDGWMDGGLTWMHFATG